MNAIIVSQTPVPLGPVTVVASAMLFLAGAWFSGVWYSPQIEARIVTPAGEPVAAAIVVASWNIQGPWNGASQGQLAIAEVTTDEDGRFRIPAWGPRMSSKGSIRIDEPAIRIFKPGFIPLVLKNYEGVPMQSAAPVIVSRFQNTTITLLPSDGSPADYEASLRPLLDSLSKIYDSRGAEFCYWKQTPRLLLALEQLKLRLADYGAGNSMRLAHQYGITLPTAACGSSQEFFLDYSATHAH